MKIEKRTEFRENQHKGKIKKLWRNHEKKNRREKKKTESPS